MSFSEITQAGLAGARAWVALLFLLAASFPALAQELRATAKLSPATTEVGEAVELRIEVEGAWRAERLPEIAVPGLQATHLGTQSSSSFVFENGRQTLSQTITHRYVLVPERAGVFTIPPLTIRTDAGEAETRPVTLTVQARGTGGDAPDRNGGRIAWAEITPLKKTAYVGEAVPLEVRIHFHPEVEDVRVESQPVVNGEGFTKSKSPPPREEHALRGGREHMVRTFRMTITPSKAGPMRIGPVEVDCAAQLPADLGRSRGGGAEDRFFNPFGFRRSVVRQMRVQADPVEVEVKPLPAAGRPASFSGAVGKFKLSAEGSPQRVRIGDPITMRLKVSGQGNFERMEAPSLAEPAGWRAYEPSSQFQAEDETGSRGTKTFEVAVIPEAKKSAMPVFAFSYFDPDGEKYVTLTSAPAPLAVEGEAASRPPGPSAEARTPSGADAAAAGRESRAKDLLGIRYDFGSTRSFEALYRQRAFWLVQAIPLALLAGVAGARAMRRMKAAGATEAARLRRERAAMIALARSAKDRTQFFDAAARVLQIDAGLRANRRAESIDAAAAKQAFAWDGDDAALASEIFESRAEALYAGGGQNGEGLSEGERERVLSLLQKSGG